MVFRAIVFLIYFRSLPQHAYKARFASAVFIDCTMGFAEKHTGSDGTPEDFRKPPSAHTRQISFFSESCRF
jgi:hypothetical protein